MQVLYRVQVHDNQTGKCIAASVMSADKHQQDGNYRLALDRYDGQDVTARLVKRYNSSGRDWEITSTNLALVKGIAHA